MEAKSESINREELLELNLVKERAERAEETFRALVARLQLRHGLKETDGIEFATGRIVRQPPPLAAVPDAPPEVSHG